MKRLGALLLTQSSSFKRSTHEQFQIIVSLITSASSVCFDKPPPSTFKIPWRCTTRGYAVRRLVSKYVPSPCSTCSFLPFQLLVSQKQIFLVLKCLTDSVTTPTLLNCRGSNVLDSVNSQSSLFDHILFKRQKRAKFCVQHQLSEGSIPNK